MNEYVHAKSIKTADACILDGDVLQHPTIPVVNETNMKKKATIKSAIIARDISEMKKKQKILGLLYFEPLWMIIITRSNQIEIIIRLMIKI